MLILSGTAILVIASITSYLTWLLFTRFSYMVYVAAIENRVVFDGEHNWDYGLNADNNSRDFWYLAPIFGEIIVGSAGVVFLFEGASKFSINIFKLFAGRVLETTQTAKIRIKRIRGDISKEAGGLSLTDDQAPKSMTWPGDE